MNFTARFFIYAPFALFILLALGVTVLWFSQAGAFSHRLDNLNGHKLMPGVTLRYASKRVEGFPFRLDVIFHDVEIEIDTPHGPSAWRTQNLALHRLTYDTGTTVFEAAGDQSLLWTDETGRHHAAPVAIGAVHASAVEASDGLSRFDLVGAGIRMRSTEIDRLELHLRRQKDGGEIEIYLAAGDMHEPANAILGEHVSQLSLLGDVVPQKPLAKLASGDEDWPTAFRRLEASGGRFDVKAFDAAFGRVHARAKGVARLDSAYRPEFYLDFNVAPFRALAEGSLNVRLAKAIRDRAAAAGADEAGVFHIVVGAKDGIIFAGSEPVGSVLTVF